MLIARRHKDGQNQKNVSCYISIIATHILSLLYISINKYIISLITLFTIIKNIKLDIDCRRQGRWYGAIELRVVNSVDIIDNCLQEGNDCNVNLDFDWHLRIEEIGENMLPTSTTVTGMVFLLFGCRKVQILCGEHFQHLV